MAKREYKGPAIDLTDLPGESHIGEKNGETVAGTTEDDLNGEDTEVWPSALDKDNFSETQQEIISRLSLQPEISYNAVARQVGCSDALVYNARQKIKEAGKADDVPFEVSRPQEGTHEQDTTERKETAGLSVKEWFIEAMSDDPDASASEIASKIPDSKDWHKQNYYNVMREGRGREELKRRIVEKGNWNQADGKIREELEGVDVDVQAGVESNQSLENGEAPDPTNRSHNGERISELEAGIVELATELAQTSDSNLLRETVEEIDDSEIVSAVLEVVDNE